MSGQIHIHAPAPVFQRVDWHWCPTCEKRSPFFRRVYEWYDPEATCLRCGEHFNEEGRAPRPFCRGWRIQNRREAIRRAKSAGFHVPKSVEVDR